MTLVSLFVSSPDTHGERRLDTALTVAQLKDKLHPVTGIAPQYQVLRVFRSSEAAENGEAPIATMTDEGSTLAANGVVEWCCIRVENTDPNARPGEFSDPTGVEKFELSEAEYAARTDTVQSYLKTNKMGRFADQPEPIAHAMPPMKAPTEVKAGARCEVSSEGGLTRRGTVRYVGLADIGKGGAWVGVELDEPMGKGDGSVEGVRYFTCPPKHAVFVRPEKVNVGDFPEEDIFASDEEI